MEGSGEATCGYREGADDRTFRGTTGDLQVWTKFCIFSKGKWIHQMKRLSCILVVAIATLIAMATALARQGERVLVRIPVSEPRVLQDLQDLDLDYAYQVLPGLERTRLFDPAYHTSGQAASYLDSLHRQYPEITSIHQIGANQQFRVPIWAIKVSDNAALDEDEFTVLYDGMHHAREPLGMECCLNLVRHLLENYGKDPAVTAMVDGIEIWVAPFSTRRGTSILWTTSWAVLGGGRISGTTTRTAASMLLLTGWT